MESEVKMPTTADKPKPTMYLDHKTFPAAKELMPGDEGDMKVHYKVRSHRQEDDGNGETQLEVQNAEHDGKKPPKKKKNAAHMPVDELKEVIKSQEKDDTDKESL